MSSPLQMHFVVSLAYSKGRMGGFLVSVATVDEDIRDEMYEEMRRANLDNIIWENDEWFTVKSNNSHYSIGKAHCDVQVKGRVVHGGGYQRSWDITKLFG